MSTWNADPGRTVPEVVEAAYGIRPLAVERLERESLNVVWRFTAADGRYTLKRLGRPAEERWLAFQDAAVTRAAAHGVPVEPLLHTLDGRSNASADGALWQVRRYVGGRHGTDGAAADLRAAAEAIAAVHAVPVDGLPEPGVNPIQDMEFWLGADAGALDALGALVCETAGPPVWDEMADAYRGAYHRARAELDLAAYHALPATLTHGEPAGSNLVFDDDGTLISLLDWDGVDIRPRVYDLARALLFLARTGRGSFRVHHGLGVDLLLRAAGEQPPSHAELRAIAPILELYFVPTRATYGSWRRAVPRRCGGTWAGRRTGAHRARERAGSSPRSRRTPGGREPVGGPCRSGSVHDRRGVGGHVDRVCPRPAGTHRPDPARPPGRTRPRRRLVVRGAGRAGAARGRLARRHRGRARDAAAVRATRRPGLRGVALRRGLPRRHRRTRRRGRLRLPTAASAGRRAARRGRHHRAPRLRARRPERGPGRRPGMGRDAARRGRADGAPGRSGDAALHLRDHRTAQGHRLPPPHGRLGRARDRRTRRIRTGRHRVLPGAGLLRLRSLPALPRRARRSRGGVPAGRGIRARTDRDPGEQGHGGARRTDPRAAPGAARRRDRRPTSVRLLTNTGAALVGPDAARCAPPSRRRPDLHVRHERMQADHGVRAGRGPRPPGTVGRPLRGTRLFLLGPDGAPVPPGATGEIVVTGPT
ncbi:phosphotransferase [Streptomyces sp. M19]